MWPTVATVGLALIGLGILGALFLIIDSGLKALAPAFQSGLRW